MSVITQIDSAPAVRTNLRPVPQCVSACTHIRMERLYGDSPCDLCRQPSPLGWLHRCTSDVSEVGDFVFVKAEEQPVSPVGEKLRALGLSESIVKQFEAGVYTDEQIQILIRQKQNLRDVIEDTPDSERCNFQVCQHCRPMHKDRCWTSFEAVFADEIRPLDKHELNGILPIKDARIAKQLGLRPPIVFTSTRGTSGSLNSPEHSPSSGYTSDGFSTDEEYDVEGCEEALSASTHEDDDDNYLPHADDLSFVTIRDTPHARTPRCTIRLLPDSKSRHQSRTSATMSDDDSPSHSHTTRSSISLPTIPTTTSYTTLPGHGESAQKLREQYSYKAMTDPEFYSGRQFNFASTTSSESSFGSEVPVEGGFALTEEAMDLNTPDLFTRV